MAVCYIVSRAIVLQGGWPLFYIEWGWCWWTIIILISTTLWRLVCSFSHCWHSYLRLSDNVLRHRKTTPELWRAKEWWFYKFQFTSRSTHLVGGCSFCILNIAYPAAGCKRALKWLLFWTKLSETTEMVLEQNQCAGFVLFFRFLPNLGKSAIILQSHAPLFR